MAIVATLMALAAPKYFKQTQRAKEVVLLQNLRGLREAIDQYRQDLAIGPESLEELAQRRYLKELPLDPVLGRRDGWIVERDAEARIREVRSGAQGQSLSGVDYAQW